VAIGALTALCGAAVHRHVWRDLPLDVPWGIVLALTSTFTVVRAAGLLVGVAGVAGAALGWVLTIIVAQPARPEGDYLLVGDVLGYAFLLGGMATVAIAVVSSIAGQSRTGRRGDA
jgi:hypothetical protein